VEGNLDESREWLRMAREALNAARLLLDQDFLRDSVSRSYYAMFYASKAAVVSEGLEANRHSAVISAFGLRFVKSGRIPADLHRSLRTAFDERQLADYTIDWQVSREATNARWVEAERFVDAVAAMLGTPR
jgi:uncharacterized protein (UPF0332 family)